MISFNGFIASVVDPEPDPVRSKIICRIRNYSLQIWIQKAPLFVTKIAGNLLVTVNFNARTN